MIGKFVKCKSTLGECKWTYNCVYEIGIAGSMIREAENDEVFLCLKETNIEDKVFMTVIDASGMIVEIVKERLKEIKL